MKNVIKLDEQSKHKESINQEFKLAIMEDPDLDNEHYRLGVDFLNNDGFYFLEKGSLEKEKEEELLKLSNIAIEYLALFSQNQVGGSTSDYYASALMSGFKNHLLYVDYDELKIWEEIKTNIRESALHPHIVNKKLSELRKGYESFEV